MNNNPWTTKERDTFLKNLAAELTEAAYAVALRHDKPGSWIDLELDLWKALGETVQKWVPPDVSPREPVYSEVGRHGHRHAARLSC
jgi:hypothetical protein